MKKELLNTDSLPYCKGCGHDLIARHTTRALDMLGYTPLDVIIVTDIGCHGIIDKCLNTHTVHGLHGRSTALGAGISFGLENPGKKVIVFIGDGGATIGLQHIMEAARLNLDMTVVVHNNMLYGMTGGQTSGLTPSGFRTSTSAEGNPFAGYDLCSLSHTAGASYVSRIMGIGDISGKLAVAIQTKGFSLTEIMEICPSYGVKFNPKRKLADIAAEAGKKMGEWTRDREIFSLHQGKKTTNLLDGLSCIEKSFSHQLPDHWSVVLSGSAGEGIQLAANMLSKAAMRSGLSVTQKGSYPVTVGVGFSTAEMNLSPDNIYFHGINVPTIAIISSQDGLNHNKKRIEKMTSGMLFIDSSLDAPQTGAKVIRHDFRGMGSRNAAIYAVLIFAATSGCIPVEAIYTSITEEGLDKKLPVDKIKEALQAERLSE